MSALANHPFVKMNGLGNEIVVLDLRGADLEFGPEEVRAIGRGPRTRFDQLMVLRDSPAQAVDAFVQIYNIDGSEAGACGNGTRCAAWVLLRGTDRRRLTLQTRTTRLACERQDDWTFAVDMGAPRLRWDEIPLREPVADTRAVELPVEAVAPALGPASAVNMGNPHAVFRVADLSAHDLARLGPLLEHHPMFPERANISLVQVAAPDHLLLRVWERGAGLTRACGSAACAAVVAAARSEAANRKALVSLPGGDLRIEWRPQDDHVLMTGPVEFEFEDRLGPDLFRGLAA